jgi:hypothetical protein
MRWLRWPGNLNDDVCQIELPRSLKSKKGNESNGWALIDIASATCGGPRGGRDSCARTSGRAR